MAARWNWSRAPESTVSNADRLRGAKSPSVGFAVDDHEPVQRRLRNRILIGCVLSDNCPIIALDGSFAGRCVVRLAVGATSVR
jgi:hypothetical protein